MLTRIRSALAPHRFVCALLTVILMLAVMLAASHVSHLATAAQGVAPLTAMILLPWQPALSRDALDALVSPSLPNQPEVVPWELYDTQNATNASAAPLTFFVNQNNDRTLSNMEGPGQLPDPQYFVCYYIACDILTVPALGDATTVPANLANVENILKTARTTFTYTMSNKNYGPFRLSMCHSTGGATGFGFGFGTAAAGYQTAGVQNGIPGYGGFPFSGALVIPPKTGFSITLNFGVAPTLVNGPIPITMHMVGTLYRKVV